VISSTRNPRVVAAARLHDRKRRREAGQALIEGPGVVGAAITGGARIVEVFTTGTGDDSWQIGLPGDTPIHLVSDAVLDKLAGSRHPRGPVAIMEIPESLRLRPTDTVVLWKIADPGNAGALIRSAAAFGFAVAGVPGTVDLWAPKVLRSAAGGHFETRFTELGRDPLSEITAAGLLPMAAVVSGGDHPESAFDGAEPIALLIGNEAHGLPGGMSGESELRSITLPLPGPIESLNAAVAGGVLMYLRSKAEAGDA